MTYCKGDRKHAISVSVTPKFSSRIYCGRVMHCNHWARIRRAYRNILHSCRSPRFCISSATPKWLRIYRKQEIFNFNLWLRWFPHTVSTISWLNLAWIPKINQAKSPPANGAQYPLASTPSGTGNMQRNTAPESPHAFIFTLLFTRFIIDFFKRLNNYFKKLRIFDPKYSQVTLSIRYFYFLLYFTATAAQTLGRPKNVPK